MQTTQTRQPATRGPAARRWIERHPFGAFVGLAYLISWLWWIPLWLGPDQVEAGVGWPTQIPGLMGPMFAAFAVTWLIDGRAGVRSLWRKMSTWRAGWWWLSVPAVLLLGAAGLLASSESFRSEDLFTYQGVSTGLGALATILIVFVCNGLGEEAGWRGFAADRLLARHSLTITSLIVASVWAPWHLPLFFLQESFRAFTAVEVIGWVFGLTAGSVVLTWLYRGSRHSILLVSVWHAAFNFTSATPAATGVVAAVSSTGVMALAVLIVVLDVRKTRRASTG